MVRITSDHIKKFVQEPVIAGFLGAVVTTLGYSWRPFLATSVPHGTLFAGVVSLVSNIASVCFAKMGIDGFKNTLLSHTVGVVVAVGGSVALAYTGSITSAVSILGVCILTLAAVVASKMAIVPVSEHLTLNENSKKSK